MKRKLLLSLILSLALLAFASPVYAYPVLPHAFYGDVEIDGVSAPGGSLVSAKVSDGTIIAVQNPVVTADGSYGIDSLKLLVQGEIPNGATIYFYVNGEDTGVTATYESGGGPDRADLSVTMPEPEPEPPPTGGGIGPGRVPPGTTDVRGEISWEGVFEEPVTAFSDDELCTLTIDEGTVGLTEDLEPLDEITILREDEPPEPPEEADIVLAYDLGPDGATFEPAITLEFSYDPDDIPEGKDVLVVAYYDEIAEAWVYLEGEVDTVSKTITVSISHFTCFAIIARAAPPPAPAAFSVTNLSVKPLEVELKEVVTISLSVANTGGTEGSYTVILKVNGVKEADKSVTIAAGKSRSVSFSVAKEKAGSYSVVVDGLSASFTVVEPVPEEVVAPPEEEEVVPEAPAEVPPAINWPVLGLIIAALVAVGLLVFFLVRKTAH